MKDYPPGQSVRSDALYTSLGVPADPQSLPVVTVTFPDGTTANPPPAQDVPPIVGTWHADFLIPPTMASGVGKIVWETTSATVDQNSASKPELFFVDPG